MSSWLAKFPRVAATRPSGLAKGPRVAATCVFTLPGRRPAKLIELRPCPFQKTATCKYFYPVSVEGQYRGALDQVSVDVECPQL